MSKTTKKAVDETQAETPVVPETPPGKAVNVDPPPELTGEDHTDETEDEKSEIESNIDEAKATETRKAESVKKIVASVKPLFSEGEMFADVERILSHHVAAPLFCELLVNRLRKVHDPTGGTREVQAIAACVARSARQVERIVAEAEKRVAEKKVALEGV